MGWSRLQSAGATAHAVTSLAATLGTLTAGTKLIAFVSFDSGSTVAVTSVRDTAANGFTEISADAYQAGFGGGTFWVLDTPAGDAGAGTTVTASFSITVDASIVVQEVSGLAAGTTASIDGTTARLTGSATGSAQGPPSYTTAAAGEYLAYALLDNGGTTGFAGPSGYTADANNVLNGNSTAEVYYKNSAGGTETGQFTPGSGSLGWLLVMAAFQLAPATVAAPPRLAVTRTEVLGGRGSNRVVRA